MSVYIFDMSLPKKGTVGIINSNGLVEIVDVDNTLLDEYQAVDVPYGRLEETGGINVTCSDCKYVREYNGRYFCYGQRFAPEVDHASRCESWKPNYVTNHKYLQDMTPEEVADFIFRDPAHLCMKTPNEIVDWLNKPVERAVFRSC